MCLTLEKLFMNSASKILHFAPEASVSQKIQRYHPQRYIGADKLKNEGRESGIIIEEMSAEDIPYPDDEFSGIISGHIMEHVEDDTQCIKSFRRVLQPKGWIMLLVPIFFHLLDIHDPNDFGQQDHKRLYQPQELMEKMRAHAFNCTSLYNLNKHKRGFAKSRIHDHHAQFRNADMLCFKV